MWGQRPQSIVGVTVLAVAPALAGLGCAGTSGNGRSAEPAVQPRATAQETMPASETLQAPGQFEERDEGIVPSTAERLLAASVRLALLSELADDALQIGVEVKGDDVLLAGTVDTEKSRQEAIRVVQGLEGVDQVSARLTLAPEGEETVQEQRFGPAARDVGRTVIDELLATQLELYLLTELGLDALRVDVEVDNGDVLLQGYVPTRQAARAAEGVVRDADGVRDVTNRLTVETGAQGG